jgi:hypothetical protein
VKAEDCNPRSSSLSEPRVLFAFIGPANQIPRGVPLEDLLSDFLFSHQGRAGSWSTSEEVCYRKNQQESGIRSRKFQGIHREGASLTWTAYRAMAVKYSNAETPKFRHVWIIDIMWEPNLAPSRLKN